MFINLGKKNKLNPARLIGMINESLDSGDAGIGKIDIMKSFSFFEIDKRVVPDLLKAVNKIKFEGVPVYAEIAKEKPPPAV